MSPLLHHFICPGLLGIGSIEIETILIGALGLVVTLIGIVWRVSASHLKTQSDALHSKIDSLDSSTKDSIKIIFQRIDELRESVMGMERERGVITTEIKHIKENIESLRKKIVDFGDRFDSKFEALMAQVTKFDAILSIAIKKPGS